MLIMDRLSCMAAFVKAVEAGSFAAAATSIGTSPQMIAKQVAYLEARLGVRLLQRTTRRQSLTEVGRSFYARSKDVLAAADDAEALVVEQNVKPRGHLRITAPSSFGRHSLVPMITAFLRAYPDITLSLNLTDRLIDLVEEECDAAFRIGATGGASIKATCLGPYRLAAYAAPDYLDRHGTPATPSALGTHEMLGYAYAARPMNQGWSFGQDGKTLSIPSEGRLDINDSDALITAALDGFGVVVAPVDAVAAHVAAGALVQIMPKYTVPTRPIYLLHVATKRTTVKLRAFLQAAESHFQTPKTAGFEGDYLPGELR
jgi:DNA-binding transcriptional LysR family regulator